MIKAEKGQAFGLSPSPHLAWDTDGRLEVGSPMEDSGAQEMQQLGPFSPYTHSRTACFQPPMT